MTRLEKKTEERKRRWRQKGGEKSGELWQVVMEHRLNNRRWDQVNYSWGYTAMRVCVCVCVWHVGDTHTPAHTHTHTRLPGTLRPAHLWGKRKDKPPTTCGHTEIFLKDGQELRDSCPVLGKNEEPHSTVEKISPYFLNIWWFSACLLLF